MLAALRDFPYPCALIIDARPDLVSAGAYDDVPEGLFTTNFGPKWIFGANGLMANQNYLFRTQTEASNLTLPDAAGGDPGKGFTCTGLAWDGVNWIVGNDGGAKETGGLAHECGIVKVSPVGVKVAEIDMRALYGLTGGATVQGVAIDPTDGSYWAAMSSSGVKHVSTAGVALSGSFAVASGNANGLCIDTKRDHILSLAAVGVGQVQIDVYNRANQAFVQTITMGANGVGGAAANFQSPDHLYYDAARDYIWITAGANGSAGQIFAYHAADFTLAGSATLSSCLAIEGLVIKDGQFVVCHDGYYHSFTSGALPAINQLQFYPAVKGFANVAWPVEYDPATGTLLGYRIEPSFTRINGAVRTQGTATWSKTNAAVTTNTNTSPLGTADANTVTATASTGVHKIESAASTAAVVGDKIVVSTMLKAGTARYVWIGDRGDNPEKSATFDLQAGVVIGSSNCTALIKNLGSGWYRCTRIYTRTLAGSIGYSVAFGAAAHTLDHPSATLTGTETFNIYACEIGYGEYPTSTLFSATESTTNEVRAADTATLALTALNFQAGGNSFVVQGHTARGVGSTVKQVLFQIDDGSASNRLRLERSTDRTMHFIVTVAGVDVCNLALGVVADDTDVHVAIRAYAANFGASVNGGAAVTSASGALPAGLTTLRPGHSFTGEQWGGWLRRLTVSPLALGDGALAAAAV